MHIRYMLVDKDKVNIDTFREMLDVYNSFECVGTFPDILEAIQFLKENSVDFVLINDKMGDGRRSGDAAFMCHLWNQQYPDMKTCLYGTDPQKAHIAVSSYSIDYLLLPLEKDGVQRIISRIFYITELLDYKRQAQNRIIMVRTKQGYELIEKNTILFVERMNRKNRMVTSDGRETILPNYSMDELENVLESCGFYRCYQSFIVNLEKVRSINVNSERKSFTLLFEGYAGEILVSREKYAEIIQLLQKHYVKVKL